MYAHSIYSAVAYIVHLATLLHFVIYTQPATKLSILNGKESKQCKNKHKQGAKPQGASMLTFHDIPQTGSLLAG